MDRFIQTITKKAGAAVLKRFGKDGVHYSKSDHRADAVTKADLLSEKIILSEIRKRYPTHGFISEESGTFNTKAEYVWVIDPIDGTLNFSLGVPLFGVMVCLVKKGEVVLSAIHLPALGELFFAKAGGGAYLNGKKIHCSRFKDLTRSIGVGSTSLRGASLGFFGNLVKAAPRMQRMMYGSFGGMAVNACYTAAGKRDWMVALVGQTHDFAPVSLILKEAGCKITDTKGRPWKFGKLEMVAANPTLHKQLLKLTKGI